MSEWREEDGDSWTNSKILEGGEGGECWVRTRNYKGQLPMSMSIEHALFIRTMAGSNYKFIS